MAELTRWVVLDENCLFLHLIRDERLTFCFVVYRYIEIFRSSLSEARAAVASIPRGGGGRGGGHEGRYGGIDRYGGGGGGGRPSPYDRNVDRFGGPGQMRHHGGGHMRRRGELGHDFAIFIRLA